MLNWDVASHTNDATNTHTIHFMHQPKALFVIKTQDFQPRSWTGKPSVFEPHTLATIEAMLESGIRVWLFFLKAWNTTYSHPDEWFYWKEILGSRAVSWGSCWPWAWLEARESSSPCVQGFSLRVSFPPQGSRLPFFQSLSSEKLSGTSEV